jgi:hypothetical protein
LRKSINPNSLDRGKGSPLEVKSDLEINDFRTTFHVSSATKGKPGGFVRVHSRENIDVKGPRVASLSDYDDPLNSGDYTIEEHQVRNQKRTHECRDSLVNRFRSLLIKQKQYARACENQQKGRSISPPEHSPNLKRPLFDMSSMKELISTIEESMNRNMRASS